MRRRLLMSTNNEKPEQATAKPVGYGNPPEATRFKKGQSGNPKGRRKGSLNAATVLAATLRERVVIKENGVRKTVTKLEAAIKQLVNKAASGDLRALQMLVAWAREAEIRKDLPSAETAALGELDQKVMERILKRVQAESQDRGEHK
jgi:hypothetical protein